MENPEIAAEEEPKEVLPPEEMTQEEQLFNRVVEAYVRADMVRLFGEGVDGMNKECIGKFIRYLSNITGVEKVMVRDLFRDERFRKTVLKEMGGKKIAERRENVPERRQFEELMETVVGLDIPRLLGEGVDDMEEEDVERLIQLLVKTVELSDEKIIRMLLTRERFQEMVLRKLQESEIIRRVFEVIGTHTVG